MRLLLTGTLALLAAGCGAPPLPPAAGTGVSAIVTIPVAPGAVWVPMAVGERWVYAASWNGLPVGTATIEATDVREIRGRRALHVACTIQPSAYIRAVYKLKDEVATDIDLETGLPLRFTKHVEEGDRLKDEYIEFDHAGKTATYYRRETGEGEKAFTPLKTLAIPEGVHDPFSCLFRARALPLKDGESAAIRVNTDGKTYDTRLKAVRRQPLFLANFGDLRSILLDPTLEYEGIFPSKGRLQMWVEEDTRVPLKLQVDIRIGTVYGELIAREGAADPFRPIPRVPDSARIGGRRPGKP